MMASHTFADARGMQMNMRYWIVATPSNQGIKCNGPTIKWFTTTMSSWYFFARHGCNIDRVEPKGEQQGDIWYDVNTQSLSETPLQGSNDEAQEHETDPNYQPAKKRKKGPSKKIRPQQLPLPMLRHLIQMFGRWSENQAPLIIVDPFCGTGSTNMAAAQQGCYSIGLDIDNGLEVHTHELI